MSKSRDGSTSKNKKKRASRSSGLGAIIAVAAGAVVVLGIIAFLIIPRNREAPDGADAAGAKPATKTGGAAPPLSADERVVFDEFQKLMQGLTNASPEERKAATDKFAADRNLSPADVLAILKKNREAREAAKRVDGKWQSLSFGTTSLTWPTQAEISVPADYAPLMSLPELQTPYLLTSVTVTGGVERRVFDLTSSREIGHWTNRIVAGHTEQVSPDGQLVCLQESSAPPKLQIVDAKSGQTVQEIASPDLFRAAHVAFIGPKQLLVLTPRTAERGPDKTQRCLFFDASTGKETHRFEREFQFAGADQIAISPNGKYLLAKGKEKSIEILESTTGAQLCALDLKNEGFQFGQIHSVAFSPDGKQIAVLEQQPLVALRLYLIDPATGAISRKVDLHGGPTSLGAPREMELKQPLVWFPNGRYVLIGKLLAVDITTGRRVWQAQGPQSTRFPSNGGLLYQVNAAKSSRLVTLPIDFSRIASTQAAWPSDAALSPGMKVSVAVDLSAGGLQELNDIVSAGMQSLLKELGFEVVNAADRLLTISLQDGAVAFKWTRGGEVLWESVAQSDTAMLPQLGHLKGQTRERALNMEGIIKLQAYPVPYFIAGDRQWTLPVIDKLNPKG